MVAVSINGFFYFPGYDNNGNVIGYWDESGSIVAEYAYDAFGNTISATGSMESVFPHRFSTKYYDAETDLYYYGYRYYSPSLGRWISRDPIKESGGNNLYSWNCNASLYVFDLLGLQTTYTIRAIGDSMTYGVRTKNDPLQFNPGHENSTDNASRVTELHNQGWRGHLKKLLSDWVVANPGKDVAFDFVGYHAESSVAGNVPHDGYPGVRASDYLKRYKHVCFDKGDIYIVFLGMNDAIGISHHKQNSWASDFKFTQDGYNQILNRIPDNEKTFLLLGKPPRIAHPVENHDWNAVNSILDKYVYDMISNAKRMRTGAVSIFELQHSKGTDDDGFHYSDTGNLEMAKILSRKIIEFVTNPSQFVSGGKK